MAEAKVTIKCNSEPLLTFIELFNLGLPSELIRIEQDPDSTVANEVSVQLYPSDAFLRFAAAVFTGKLDFCTINNSTLKTSKKKGSVK